MGVISLGLSEVQVGQIAQDGACLKDRRKGNYVWSAVPIVPCNAVHALSVGDGLHVLVYDAKVGQGVCVFRLIGT